MTDKCKPDFHLRIAVRRILAFSLALLLLFQIFGCQTVPATRRPCEEGIFAAQAWTCLSSGAIR